MADEFRERKPKEGLLTTKEQEIVFEGRPTGIRAPHGATIFEITWPKGLVHKIPNEILRGYCPCAGCQGHSGQVQFQEGRNHELRDLKSVGNYALALVWGDAHDTGIYSFEFLFRLGQLHAELGTAGLIEMHTLPRGAIVRAGSGT